MGIMLSSPFSAPSAGSQTNQNILDNPVTAATGTLAGIDRDSVLARIGPMAGSPLPHGGIPTRLDLISNGKPGTLGIPTPTQMQRLDASPPAATATPAPQAQAVEVKPAPFASNEALSIEKNQIYQALTQNPPDMEKVHEMMRWMIAQGYGREFVDAVQKAITDGANLSPEQKRDFASEMYKLARETKGTGFERKEVNQLSQALVKEQLAEVIADPSLSAEQKIEALVAMKEAMGLQGSSQRWRDILGEVYKENHDRFVSAYSTPEQHREALRFQQLLNEHREFANGIFGFHENNAVERALRRDLDLATKQRLPGYGRRAA